MPDYAKRDKKTPVGMNNGNKKINSIQEIDADNSMNL